MSAVAALLKLAFRYDVGMLLGRVSLFLPIWLLGQALDDPVAFGNASALYHSCLFLSSVGLFGLHEAMLVSPEGRRDGPWLVMLLSLGVGGFAAALASFGWLAFSWGLFVFLFGYRSAYLVTLSAWRQDPLRYSAAATGLAMSMALIVYSGRLSWTAALPPLALFGWVASRELPGVGVYRMIPWMIRAVARYRHYGGNFLLSTIYVQGALFLYSILASDLHYAFATNFVYLMAIVFIGMDLVYRRLLVDAGTAPVNRRLIAEALYVLVGFAGIFALLVVALGQKAESVLLGSALVTGDALAVTLLVSLVLVHTLNFLGAGLLVGTGHVRLQFRVNLLMLLIVSAVLVIGGISSAKYALPVALLTASVVGALLRWTLIRNSIGFSPAPS